MAKARDGPRNLGRFGVFSPPKNGSVMTSVSAALLYRVGYRNSFTHHAAS